MSLIKQFFLPTVWTSASTTFCEMYPDLPTALPNAAKERTDKNIQYAGPHSLDPVHIDVKKLQTGHDDPERRQRGEENTSSFLNHCEWTTDSTPVLTISLFTNKKENRLFLPCVSVTVVPDVEAAKHGKEDPRRQGHGYSQQEGQEAVAPQPGHLEQGVTPQPNSIKAPHGGRFCYHILKHDLDKHKHRMKGLVCMQRGCRSLELRCISAALI